MIFFSVILTKCTFLLYQRNDYSCYVSREILAPPPRWLQKHTDLSAHKFMQCHELWHKLRLAKFTCAWSWRLCGITPATPNCRYTSRISSQFHKAHSCSTKALMCDSARLFVLNIWGSCVSVRLQLPSFARERFCSLRGYILCIWFTERTGL
jgi:hypothetical protein